MLTIKILGPGCANCKRLEEIVRKAASELNVAAEFTKVTDYDDILAYDLVSTPGLVINEKLVSSGRIPSPASVATWIAEAMQGT
jgi:small redox-active disulfide protein 2